MSPEVRAQARKCFYDLAGVITTGAKNNSAKRAAAYAKENFAAAGVTILSTGQIRLVKMPVTKYKRSISVIPAGAAKGE
mgnify:CR=1 FL=1